MTDENYRPEVKVKRSSAGLGLFLGETVQKGQLIIEYTGARITPEEADIRGGRYLFEVTSTLTIDGKGRENIARYINHGCKPNAEAEQDEAEDRIYIRAKKKIVAGEEVTYDYGKEYMKHIIGPEGCRCASCVKK
ncbi:MAG: SET domain-containing protein [Patiriisocius sp.]|jgi:SET domain-containing protein